MCLKLNTEVYLGFPLPKQTFTSPHPIAPPSTASLPTYPALALFSMCRPPPSHEWVCIQLLTTCPAQVSCLVPGLRWVMVTSTAWTFSCLGGMEQTL